MAIYADPLACPDCSDSIEPGAPACVHCGLPLRGPVAQELFATLQRADQLVATLRSTTFASTGAVAGVPGAPLPGPTPPRSATYVPPVPYPSRPDQEPERPSFLEAASIPKILLGLGATCLLVAALVFLAVAWSSMGMGGRTVVLVALTVIAGGLMALMARKDLRTGAEAFATVMLGLVALDVTGADNAGWLDVGEGWFEVILGATVAAAACSVAAFGQRSPIGRIVAGELAAGLGALFAGFGLLVALPAGPGALVATVTTVAFAAVSERSRLRDLALGLVVVGCAWWLALALDGVDRTLHDPTLHGVWVELDGWPLLAAAALAAVPAAVTRLAAPLRVCAAGAAALLLTFLATVALVDSPATHVALVGAGVLAVAALAMHRLPSPWTWAPSGVLVPAAVLTVFGAALQATMIAARYDIGPWSATPGRRLGPVDLPLEPWALMPLVGALALTLAVGASLADVRVAWPRLGVVVASLTGAATAASYDVPLGVPFAVLLVGLASAWLLEYSDPPAIGTLALAVVLLLSAVPSDWLTLVALATLLGIAVVADRLDPEALGAPLVELPLAGAAIGTLAAIADWPPTWTGVGVLALLGVVAILLPRPATEIGAAVTGIATVVAQAPDLTWLAVDLTVAGALVTVSALVHRRSELGYAGTALLLGATWVRLVDTRVDTPEAYTLPLAALMLGFGLWRMWRPASGSAAGSSALLPGLGVATVPSLLISLGDPVATRALLLGAGCLALVLVGVWLRWSTPLLVGAGVGLLLVLREASYASVVPQWVVIALVGGLLTVVGVTWEQRLRDLRLATGYVRGLR